jgi:signal transduction histidine kinase
VVWGSRSGDRDVRRLLRRIVSRLTPRSFRGRIVASTVLLVGAVMVGVVVGLQLILGWTAARDIDGALSARAQTAVDAVRAASDHGSRLVVPDELDPGAMVYDSAGRVVRGSIEAYARDEADDLAERGRPATASVGDGRVRLTAVPFSTAGGAHGVVVVSEEAALYERAETYTLVASILIGLVVVGLAAYTARRVTTQALEPVTQMAQRAADWSEHDLNHRFDLEPADDELAQLGSTLDRLLDRVAIAIRSEQRLTSEMAHELRTPLTAIQGSADLALLREHADPETRADLEEIASASRAMAQVITTLVDVARAPLADGASTCRVTDLVPELRRAVPDGLTFVDRTGESSARIAGPREVVVRALSPLVDNAVRHARSRVEVCAEDGRHHVTIRVVDDGAGVDPAVRDRVFETGASSTGGTGLGLAIARRVASSLGGTIAVDPTPPGQGAVLVVRMPRA